MIFIIIFSIIIVVIALLCIIFIKSKPNPAAKDSPEYLQALDSLSTSVRGGIALGWTNFLAAPSDRDALINPRDTFESFPQYFPSDVGMSPDSLSGSKITDPYELLLFYINGIYKNIGSYNDNETPATLSACTDILKNAAATFGSTTVPNPILCQTAASFVFTGTAKLEGTNMTWNDYFNKINSSTQNNYQHTKIKYQYWIKGISPVPALNDLDNMALLIISQCTSSLSIFNDLLKIIPAAGGFLTGHYNNDKTKITNFHELRKVLRSLIRTFTEFCESSPLTYFENCSDKVAAAKILTCTDVPCCQASQTPIAACIRNLSGNNFIQVLKLTNNPKLISLTAIALLGEKADCNFNKNCNSTCTSTPSPGACSPVSTPANSCGITNCSAADGSNCDWKSCDLVSWFGNIHDNMVQYLPALKAGYSGVDQLRDWINQSVANIIAYLKLYLAKYLYYIMFSSWKESFTRACESAPGQLMLRGPSNKSENGWLCWNDSIDSIAAGPQFKILNCNYY